MKRKKNTEGHGVLHGGHGEKEEETMEKFTTNGTNKIRK
jgi:hypothetical protein